MKKTVILGAVIILILLVLWILTKPKTPTTPLNNTVSNSIVPEGTVPAGSNSAPAPEASAPAVVKAFTIEGKNFSFTPTELKVKKGDTVKITFKNVEGFHDFVIDEFNARTKQIQASNTAETEFIASKTGTFEFYCSVGEHRAKGMKGTLVVE